MSWRRQPNPELARCQAELARFQAEAATLRTVLAQVEAAVLAVDRDHRRLYANPAAERLWALGPEAGARVAALARLPELPAALEEVAATGSPWRRRLLFPDGRHWDVALAPLDAGGGCVVVARDVTESVRLETVRRDFVAALSHELRTPLTSIQGYAELLLGQPEPAPPARAEHLGVIVKNAERLTRLAQDLLLLSSLETGAYQFRFQELDASTLALPAIEVMAPLAREFHCRLALGLNEPGQVRADADALHRVLLNLLENAMVHGQHAAAGAALEVSLSGARESRHYVWRVRDNGPGIAAAEQPRVFERFYQVGAGHTTAASGQPRRGAGLGLAVVKHVVLEHGGEATVESSLGQGSTFIVRVPLAHNGDHP